MRFYQKMFEMVVLFFSASILLSSCGGGGGGGNDTGTSATHAVTAFAGTIKLAWDAPTTNIDGTPLTDLAGYKIYYGPTSGSYTNTLDVGNVTTSAVNNLTDGLTYYFTVSAYNSAGVESSFSNEVSKTLPSTQLTLTAFTVTATADIGGTITPAGTTGVNYGANQTFTIAPGAGYYVATVLVDGESTGAVTTYTFTSVTANHTIAATFAQNPSSTITASNNYDTAIFETGTMDGYDEIGDGGRSPAQHHGGSYAVVIDTGYYDFDETDGVYIGPGGLFKTLNTRTGTMSVWVYCFSDDIWPGGATLDLHAGGTTTSYSGAGLHAGWYEYTHAFNGASSDPISITVDNSNHANWVEMYIDDIAVPVQ
jgi:hypothetical protein